MTTSPVADLARTGVCLCIIQLSPAADVPLMVVEKIATGRPKVGVESGVRDGLSFDPLGYL
jgi:hypothetical protein